MLCSRDGGVVWAREEGVLWDFDLHGSSEIPTCPHVLAKRYPNFCNCRCNGTKQNFKAAKRIAYNRPELSRDTSSDDKFGKVRPLLDVMATLEYNRHMGRVDKLDFIMSLYYIRAKIKKKLPVRLISHLTSFALANSWLEYLRAASAEFLVRKNTKDMLQFQTDIEMSLLVSNKTLERKRGRPSAENL